MLVYVAEQIGLCIIWLETPKQVFLWLAHMMFLTQIFEQDISPVSHK